MAIENAQKASNFVIRQPEALHNEAVLIDVVFLRSFHRMAVVPQTEVILVPEGHLSFVLLFSELLENHFWRSFGGGAVLLKGSRVEHRKWGSQVGGPRGISIDGAGVEPGDPVPDSARPLRLH